MLDREREYERHCLEERYWAPPRGMFAPTDSSSSSDVSEQEAPNPRAHECCPNCNGHGLLWNEGTPREGDDPSGWFPCPVCDGYGWLDEARDARLRAIDGHEWPADFGPEPMS